MANAAPAQWANRPKGFYGPVVSDEPESGQVHVGNGPAPTQMFKKTCPECGARYTFINDQPIPTQCPACSDEWAR